MSTFLNNVNTIVIIGTGNRIYSTGMTLFEFDSNEMSKYNWYQKIINSDGELVILSDDNYFRGVKSSTVIGRIIKDFNNQYAGIMFFVVDNDTLITLNPDQTQVQNKYGVRIIVSNKAGDLIIDSDSHLDNYNSDSLSHIDMEDYLVRENYSEVTDLNIRIIIPRKNILNRISLLKYTNIYIIIISFLLTALFSLLLSYSITKPLIRLQKSMLKVENGDYSVISVDASNDEIQKLIKTYNIMITKIKTLFRDVYMAKLKQKEAQFLALQHQINPHMLHNTLESIRMKAAINNDVEVSDMLKTLGKMLRLTLNRDNKRNYTIADEIDYTKTYVKLQNIRFDNRFELIVNLITEILNSQILKLIFQPIVENSITHGFLDHDRNYCIEINGHIYDNKDIVISFIDNGNGIEPNKLMALNESMNKPEKNSNGTNSIGLKNIHDRIKLHYGDKYYLKFYSTPGKGTTVKIMIPKV